jgi:hypothetical protein
MTLGHPDYQIIISDPEGSPLADASRFVALSYPRAVNMWSTMTLTLPSTFPQQYLRIPDGRIEIWRRGPSGMVLDTETTWLIKAPEWDRDEAGRETITIEADTPLCILKEPGHFVDWAATTSQAEKTDFADDMLKAIAAENIGDSAGALRDLSAYISIAPDASLAPSLSKAFAWRDVLKTMQEIANASAEAGTYLAFDIVAPTQDTFEFRTYTGWRGVDHRFPNGINPVIIGPAFGNMGECRLRTDYRNEITYAKAGGRGDGINRLLGEAQDDARIGLSPFGRRETFVNATQYTTTTGLDAEAEAVVRNGRPRSILQGTLLSVPGCQYGVHWGWGDFVTVQAFGQSLDCRIDAVTVTVAQGKETIKAVLRNDL